MKRGYRLSSFIALYHYRNDKVANFNLNAAGYGAIGGSVLGGIGGYLSAPEDASLVDRLGRGALGAGIGAGAGYAGGKAYRFGKRNWNEARAAVDAENAAKVAAADNVVKKPAAITEAERLERKKNLKYNQLIQEGYDPDTARATANSYNYKANPNEDLEVFANPISPPMSNYRRYSKYTANFAPGWMSNAWNAVKSGAKNIDDLAVAGTKAVVYPASRGINTISNNFMPNSFITKPLKSISRGVGYLGTNKVTNRMLGYGVPIAGAVGALGGGYYLGSKLRGNQNNSNTEINQ